jgi:hypothetical protein
LLSKLPFKYEYQSDFARLYVAEGRAEGRIEGSLIVRRIVLRVLGHRFGKIDEVSRKKLEDASLMQLDEISERMLTAPSLEEALGCG